MYLWIKALHVVAIISWMAGLLYLPRLFVYHSQVERGETSEVFKAMERRLLRFIMTPAMIVAWGSGVFLIAEGGWRDAGWLHVKLALAALLTLTHFYFQAMTRAFANDANRRSTAFLRAINEVPTLLMIGVVALVIVKPF